MITVMSSVAGERKGLRHHQNGELPSKTPTAVTYYGSHGTLFKKPKRAVIGPKSLRHGSGTALVADFSHRSHGFPLQLHFSFFLFNLFHSTKETNSVK